MPGALKWIAVSTIMNKMLVMFGLLLMYCLTIGKAQNVRSITFPKPDLNAAVSRNRFGYNQKYTLKWEKYDSNINTDIYECSDFNYNANKCIRIVANAEGTSYQFVLRNHGLKQVKNWQRRYILFYSANANPGSNPVHLKTNYLLVTKTELVQIVAPTSGPAHKIWLTKASEQLIVLRVRTERPLEKYVIYDCPNQQSPYSNNNRCTYLTLPGQASGNVPLTVIPPDTSQEASSKGQRDNVFKVKLPNANTLEAQRGIYVGVGGLANTPDEKYLSFVYSQTPIYPPINLINCDSSNSPCNALRHELLLTTKINQLKLSASVSSGLKPYSFIRYIGAVKSSLEVKLANLLGVSDYNVKILNIYNHATNYNKSVVHYEVYVRSCEKCDATERDIMLSRMDSFNIYKSLGMYIREITNTEVSVSSYGNLKVFPYGNTAPSSTHTEFFSEDVLLFLFVCLLLCCCCYCCLCRAICKKRSKLMAKRKKEQMIYEISQGNYADDDDGISGGKDANIQVVDENNIDELLGVATAEPIDKEFYKNENFIGGKILRIVEC